MIKTQNMNLNAFLFRYLTFFLFIGILTIFVGCIIYNFLFDIQIVTCVKNNDCSVESILDDLNEKIDLWHHVEFFLSLIYPIWNFMINLLVNILIIIKNVCFLFLVSYTSLLGCVIIASVFFLS